MIELKSEQFYPFLAPPQNDHSMQLEFAALQRHGTHASVDGHAGVQFQAHGINGVRYYPPSVDRFGNTDSEQEDRALLTGYLQTLAESGADVTNPLGGLPTEGSVTVARTGDIFVARVSLDRVRSELDWTDGPITVSAPFRPDINDQLHTVTGIQRGASHGLVYIADAAKGRWAFKVNKPRHPQR